VPSLKSNAWLKFIPKYHSMPALSPKGNHMTYAINIATAFFHADGKAPNGWALRDETKFAMYYLCMAVFEPLPIVKTKNMQS